MFSNLRAFGARSLIFVAAGALLAGGHALAAGRTMSVAELALYQGSDREQILLEGAKREGQLTFYNSHTWFRTFAREFEKKYPAVKVSEWRSDSKDVLKRVSEEFKAGRFLADVIETTAEGMSIMKRQGVFQEYYTPEARYYPEEVKVKGKNGLYYLGDRATYISLGFNTQIVPPAEAPRTLKDLLDPKWKGKISMVTSSTGVRWIGAVLETHGREYLEKMSAQEMKLQNMSGAALAGLIATGEVPLSPTIFDANIYTQKQKGAPVEWRPLEPVIASAGYSGITAKAPHPHAALLFLDYLHSREGQRQMMRGGLWSQREDIETAEQKFNKFYLDERYSLEELEKKFAEWEKLMHRLFMRKK